MKTAKQSKTQRIKYLKDKAQMLRAQAAFTRRADPEGARMKESRAVIVEQQIRELS